MAAELDPPRPILDIKEVMEFTQIGQFDFLRDSRYNIHAQPWAQPLGRRAMDVWFKLERAREECARVRVEARRLFTFIKDEEMELADCIHKLLDLGNNLLAEQLKNQLSLLVSQNFLHTSRLTKLSNSANFCGSLSHGVRLGRSHLSVSLEDSKSSFTQMQGDTTIDDEIDSDDDEILESLNFVLDAMEITD
jgi:hypothetical protein